MTLIVSAIYENGILRPISDVGDLANGTSVVLTVQASGEPDGKGEQRSLTHKELHDLIRAKIPHLDGVTEEMWEELHKSLEVTQSNVRDPEIMKQASARMDQLREQIYKRERLLDIVVPLLRESRDEDPRCHERQLAQPFP